MEAALGGVERESVSLDLRELFGLSSEEFRHRFKPSALWRTRRRGLLRNAAIVLGNQRDPRAVPVLCRALADEESLVRGAAAWALGRFDLAEAQTALRDRLPAEPDDTVKAEIFAALQHTKLSNATKAAT